MSLKHARQADIMYAMSWTIGVYRAFLCGRPIRPHYWSYPSVCPVRAPNLETKRLGKTSDHHHLEQNSEERKNLKRCQKLRGMKGVTLTLDHALEVSLLCSIFHRLLVDNVSLSSTNRWELWHNDTQTQETHTTGRKSN